MISIVRPVESCGSQFLWILQSVPQMAQTKNMEIHGNPEPHLAKNAMCSGPRPQAKYR